MSNRKLLSLMVSSALGLTAALTTGQARAQSDVQTVGPTDEVVTSTFIFNIKNQNQLENYIQQTVTPGTAHYRDFLTVNEFATKYAPGPGQIAAAERYLRQQGYTIVKVFDNHLAITVSAPAATINQVLQTQLTNYTADPATNDPHRRAAFHRPKFQPRIPKILTDNGVAGVVGLSNEYKYLPMHTSKPNLNSGGPLKVLSVKSNTIANGVPGDLTVGDVANLYNINPLYAAGNTGKGVTLGIATYADFLPQDAYDYWDLYEVAYSPNRISQVHIDGGGEYGADAGSGETSLDVEQSGGLAPKAKIIVYDAPNTGASDIDLFYQIVSDNKVDSLSYSWGLPEIFYSAPFNGGVDQTSTMTFLNQSFMEAAVQGISMFTAAGDSGAYDTARSYAPPTYSNPLTVDWPSASPYMTAAGGTTLPATISFYCGDGFYDVNIPTEQAWGADYLNEFLDTCYGLTPIQAGTFSDGGGGGVSVYWATPWYQQGVEGIATSASGQTFATTGRHAYTYLTLPTGFAGRNVPDISMNADPETGYLVQSSADGGLGEGSGGTSFVAPQLNGIAALMTQANGGRIGLLAPQLYRLLGEYGYGEGSPFRDVTEGDNWGYQSAPGYDQASGIGVPDVEKLSALLVTPPDNGGGRGTRTGH